MEDLIEVARQGELHGARFSELIGAASRKEIAALVADPEARTLVLDGIFEQMPKRLKADKAAGMTEVIHWHVEGAPGGGVDSYEVRIDDGAATVSRELSGEPRVSFTADPVALLRMIAGETTGMKLMLSRKLKVKGDMMFAPRIQGLFETDPAAF
jgi:putative sterol carrier protein